jgi:hypothetical protein
MSREGLFLKEDYKGENKNRKCQAPFLNGGSPKKKSTAGIVVAKK